MDMASNDIRLETKNGQFIAMSLHSFEKEIFVAANLVLIKKILQQKYRWVYFQSLQ